MRPFASRNPHAPLVAIDFLERHDAAAALLPTAERLVRLKRDLLARVPPALRDSVEVTGADDGAVVLHVASASAAAKLRQTLPRLQEGLSANGWTVDSIRIRVRPRMPLPGAAPAPRPQHPPIPTAAVAAFETLGESLEASPLRDALERLVSRRRDAEG